MVASAPLDFASTEYCKYTWYLLHGMRALRDIDSWVTSVPGVPGFCICVFACFPVQLIAKSGCAIVAILDHMWVYNRQGVCSPFATSPMRSWNGEWRGKIFPCLCIRWRTNSGVQIAPGDCTSKTLAMKHKCPSANNTNNPTILLAANDAYHVSQY